MIKAVIGIDPGKSGGVCLYDGSDLAIAFPCPSDDIEMADSISSMINGMEIEGIPVSRILVAIENVHAFPTDTRSSAFKFRCNYGTWLGICASNKLEVEKIHPRTWMKYYGDYPKGKQERKRYFRSLAKDYFPDARVTLKTADAILIAKYRLELEEE